MPYITREQREYIDRYIIEFTNEDTNTAERQDNTPMTDADRLTDRLRRVRQYYTDRICGYNITICTKKGDIRGEGRNGTHNFNCNVTDDFNEDFPHTAEHFAIIKAREVLGNVGIDWRWYKAQNTLSAPLSANEFRIIADDEFEF
jgi:hypothetical protein